MTERFENRVQRLEARTRRGALADLSDAQLAALIRDSYDRLHETGEIGPEEERGLRLNAASHGVPAAATDPLSTVWPLLRERLDAEAAGVQAPWGFLAGGARKEELMP
jgi:hypothetical protein